MAGADGCIDCGYSLTSSCGRCPRCIEVSKKTEINHDRSGFGFPLEKIIERHKSGQSQSDDLKNCIEYILKNEMTIKTISDKSDHRSQEIIELKAKLYDYQNRD